MYIKYHIIKDKKWNTSTNNYIDSLRTSIRIQRVGFKHDPNNTKV